MAFNVAVELLHDTQHTAAQPVSGHGENVDMERETAGEWCGWVHRTRMGVVYVVSIHQAMDTYIYTSMRLCLRIIVDGCINV